MEFSKLLDLVDGDEFKANNIWGVSRIVMSYFQFKSIQDLGLSIRHDALTFEKAMMFSWIKEAVDRGRKI